MNLKNKTIENIPEIVNDNLLEVDEKRKVFKINVEPDLSKSIYDKDAMEKWIQRHDFKIASHNSMTYLTPSKWYLRPIAFTARCQSKTIQEQYKEYGAQLFDLRFKFNKKGEVHFAHGLIEYKGDHIFIVNTLEFLDSIGVPVRIICENKDGEFEQEFYEWCKWIEETFTNAKWCCGRNKYSWKQIYQFKNPELSVEDKYSSYNTDEPGKSPTGSVLDDICPIWYAKKNNKKNKQKGTWKDYLMIDFVDIE